MDHSGDVDKFASIIIPNCQISTSQEAKLQSCPFAPQSEVLPEKDVQSSEDTWVQATEVSMVSVSSEEYQTPPEHHRSHSENSSNDGHVSPAAVDKEMKSRDGEAVVVLDDDEDDDADEDDDNDHDYDPVINSTNETDSDKSDHNDTPTAVNNNSDSDGSNNTDGVNDIDTEELVSDACEVDLVGSLNNDAHEVFVEMPEREQEAANVSGTKVDTTLLSKGKRKLPFSLNVQEKKRDGYFKHQTFLDSLNRVSKMLVRDANSKVGDDGETDFYATAKMRGMTFPRPHWWPPEGSDK